MGSFIGSLLGTENNATAALPGITKQDNLLSNINTANQGIQENLGNQNAFAQALKNQMEGGGPNLAGAQLANATGQNVQNQAALMASQRGTGSNTGLIARQAAQQGANIQQQSAGQAAANRASQQLNAQGQLGNVYGQIGQEQGQNLGIQQNALAGQNNTITEGTLKTNQINSDIAKQNAASHMAMITGAGQAIAGMPPSSGASGSTQSAGSKAGYGASTTNSNPNAKVNDWSNLAEGGEVHPHKSIIDIYHNGYNSSTNQYAEGGKVNALVSPGERFLKPDQVKKVAKGQADPIETGEKIPGKPKVSGAVDSYVNDTVKKKLPEGGIVIPRSITQGKDPKKAAFAFVVKELAKSKKGRK